MTQIGKRLRWPYVCCLCGNGFGETGKVTRMAIALPVNKPERFTADVVICTQCKEHTIGMLITYLENMEE